MMNTLPEPGQEILPSNPIRVETALSRYPVHRLARKGNIKIDVHEQGGRKTEIIWKVSYNTEWGQPGPLAYKLDTLIINRRIEESARPIPKIIRLGSIREIIKELGSKNHDTEAIKRSLHQNASAYITPKIRYRQSDGSEQTLETGFTRYSVVFTGEKLPNGRKADAVYIVLNDIYMQVINGAMTRPLDYDYLKTLLPGPQRFYELLSYRMYASIKNDRPRAKLLYSELCTYAPQTRYHDWEHARKQMAKIHRPHKKSGYIARVDYQDITDGDGNLDWVMLYQPGPKARAEYRAFAKRGGPVMLEVEPFAADPPALVASQQAALPLTEPEPPLVAELVRRGVTRAAAAGLAQQYPAELIERKIEVFDWLTEKQDKRIAKSPEGYLCESIRKDYATPRGFVGRAERQRRQEAKQARESQAAEESRRQREEEARRKEADAYIKRLTPDERAALEAAALAHASAESRQHYDNPALARYRDTFMLGMMRDHVQAMLKSREQVPAEG
jgi:hypothetical protein